LAALATLATPVFLLCASTLMRDTLMAALWVWAIYWWITGLEGRPAFLALAAALITACTLAKYFGIALIPLLLAYSIWKRRAAGLCMLWLLAPIAAMAGYELWAHHLYGKILAFNATHYAGANREGEQLFSKLVTGLAFSGGCTFLTIAALPLFFGKRLIGISLLGAAVLALILASMKRIGVFDTSGSAEWLVIAHLAVLGCGGALLFALAILDIWSRRTADSLLLLLWLTGVFIFATRFNWTISGRNMLPLAPAAACLVVRRIERAKSFAGKDAAVLFLAPVAVTACVALSLTFADTQFALDGKGAAQVVANRMGGAQMERVKFQGHWGFQYYMEEFGARALNYQSLELRPGDILVIPSGNSIPIRLPQERLKFLERYSLEMPHWVCIHNFAFGAGYYSDNWGPSPYIFGAGSPDVYSAYRFE